MPRLKIGAKWVGDGEPTLVIAEAGSNHDGSVDQARRLIDAAADAGADVVKFQVFSAETLYQRANPAYPVIRANELPRAWLPALAAHAEKRGIAFTATPFDRAAVDALCDLPVPFLKWASAEIHDLPLLAYAARKGRPLVVSTGMCTLADVEAAVDSVQRAGNGGLVLLHCASLYPTEPRHVNLRMMDTLRQAFQVPVGLSDHTTSVAVPVAAVARGASVIEKHFTLSRALPGPDHSYALEPDELTRMVQGIREVEASLGDAVKKPVPGVENVALNHRSLVATRAIRKGEVIASDMLTTKRSRTGVEPHWHDLVVGRTAQQDIPDDEAITWNAI